MKKTLLRPLASLLCGAMLSGSVMAADVKELMKKPLADYPGKEAVLLEVSYPPGAKDVAHRHDAHALLYVLEGTIQMQLKGGPLVTVRAGETFYEGPDDIHLIGRNASNSAPARFVVVLLKAQGSPVLTPVDGHK
ncbi:MAG TPA: cupin domain-containing protein [Roseateles sp.]|nr:cupin domain-containing protein [Roseateles sp.]